MPNPSPSTSLSDRRARELRAREVFWLLKAATDDAEAARLAEEYRTLTMPAPLVDRPAPKLARCIHLGAARPEMVKVECVGCGGKKMVEHPVFECVIYHRCLISYRGPWDADHELESQLYALCRRADGTRCPSFEQEAQ